MIPFDVSVARNGDSITIAVRGELDLATVDRAREALDEVPADTPVVLDLSRLTFIDSTGLGLIAAAAKQTDGQLTVIPDARTRRLLDLTGMTDQLTLLDDQSE